MRQTLIALFCVAALHALPEEFKTPEEILKEITKEVNTKVWGFGDTGDEWKELAKTLEGRKDASEILQNARIEKWGMHLLKRYTEIFERYPDADHWVEKQDAHNLWVSIESLKKPEFQKYLDEWKVKWPGDRVIERRFYTSRLRDLPGQFPDIGDAEKIARTLMAEFPARREPYRALLSIARRKGAEAYEATLREILNRDETPEKIKVYLNGKTGDVKKEETAVEKYKNEPYDYRGGREPGDMEIDHYEIRYAQLMYPKPEEWEDLVAKEKEVSRKLIKEFPEQTRPYSQLYFCETGGFEGSLSDQRAWMLAFVKGPAPDVVKAELANYFICSAVRSKLSETFRLAILSRIESYLPVPGEEKAWLEKHMPLWRTYLEAYADFVDVLLQRANEDGEDDEDEMSLSRWDAIHLLDALLEVTDEPEYRRHLKEINAKWLALTGWSEEERMRLRSAQLFAQEADARGEVVRDPRLIRYQAEAYPPEVYERVTRTLIKEFPQQKNLYDNLTHVAERQDPWDRALFQEVLDNTISEYTKKWAQQRIALLNRVGQPFELKGIAINMERRERMPLQQMKGNVALIHFWATWNKSSIEELPRIKGLYDTYHAQGFEVISISDDKTPMLAEAFLEKNPLPWPQQWHPSREDFDLRSLPALWLVDKQGIVRDVNAQKGTEQKIEKLLAEP